MILDQVSNLRLYKGISKNIDVAIEYLRKNDVCALPDGRHAIDGDVVYVQVMSYQTKPLAEATFEAHRRYIDIQILIEGEELCYYAPLQGLVASLPFDQGKDIGFYKGAEGSSFPLRPGTFALFFPHDAHKPSCDFKGRSPVRKAVVKIAG